jgi:hypothetical protein
MMKKVFISLAAVAIIATAGWNVKQSMDLQSKNEMSALTLANIEALTWPEGDFELGFTGSEVVMGYEWRNGLQVSVAVGCKSVMFSVSCSF